MKGRVGYFPSTHACTLEKGDKVMRLLESVTIHDDKLQLKCAVKLSKNQVSRKRY